MFAVFVTSTLWEPFAFKINKNIFIWNKRICALLLMNFHVFCKFHRCGMAFEIRLFFLLCDQLCPPCLTSRPSLVNSFWNLIGWYPSMATVTTVFSRVSRDKMAAGRLYSQLRVSQLPTISWDYLFTKIHILNSFGSILLISGWNRMKFIQNIV